LYKWDNCLEDLFEEDKSIFFELKKIAPEPLVDFDFEFKNEEEQSAAIQNFESVRAFVEQAEKNLYEIPLQEIADNLKKALLLGTTIENSFYKTTLLLASERLAKNCIENCKFKEAFDLRVKVAQAFGFSPLIDDLKEKLKHEDPILGLSLYPLGATLLKNHTIAVQKQFFEEENGFHLHVEGKLSHYFIKELGVTLDLVKNQSHLLLNALPPGFCSNVTFTKEKLTYFKRMDNGQFSKNQNYTLRKFYPKIEPEFTTIHFHGVGKVRIGNGTGPISHHNFFSIDLDPTVPEDDAGTKLVFMLGVLGLGGVLSSTRKVDEKRIKIFQLFRAHFPGEAFRFERDAKSYTEQIKSLKHRITVAVPPMAEKFQQYMKEQPDLMYRQEVFPGQFNWAVQGLADQVRIAGGIGLMSSLSSNNVKEGAERISSILKNGALSTQDRFQRGILINGWSRCEDFGSGGADSVFTRMVTNKMSMDPAEYAAVEKQFQIIYDLKLIERVGYAYSFDRYGSKKIEDYPYRSNVLETANQENLFCYQNEVCIKNRVPPSYIKGILIDKKLNKNDFIDELKQLDMITINQNNEECINDISVDKFIHQGDFDQSYWD